MKACRFIRIKEHIYVASPTSWLEGWARQRWLESYFGHDATIKSVNPDSWADMCQQNKVMILTENAGKYSESLYVLKKKDKNDTKT